MNQQGVTFLEIVVVIAILMITSALVAPSIQDWRQKRALESDFLAILAQIDYLKARARTLNGTSLLICNDQGGVGGAVGYIVSKNNQTDVYSLPAGLKSIKEQYFFCLNPNNLKDPKCPVTESYADIVESRQNNILSGVAKVSSSICQSTNSGVFLATGQAGAEGSGAQIDIKISAPPAKGGLSDYRILVNQSTGFIQKFRGSLANGAWMEID